jgi:hypothetical protein
MVIYGRLAAEQKEQRKEKDFVTAPPTPAKREHLQGTLLLKLD